MRSLTTLIALGVSVLAAPRPSMPIADAAAPRQGPFTFPLPNGFPSPNATALSAIEAQAHGTLPNSPLPKSISDDSVPVLELIAFNEIFEVAFFTDLIANITNGVQGYGIGDSGGLADCDQKQKVLNSLNAIVAQEQLHALGANAILTSAGHAAIAPCQYAFPVDNFHDAIGFAASFTDVVIGTLEEAIHEFAVDGDVELTTLIASVVGQEGEQDGFFRLTEGGITASARAFLTASSGPFAFSALNHLVVVPQTCPNISAIKIPILAPLDTNHIDYDSGAASFSFDNSTNTGQQNLSVVFVNQQNLPVVEQLQNVTSSNGNVTFDTKLPLGSSGLVIAALTSNPGPFANASEVAAAAVFGPALIEVPN